MGMTERSLRRLRLRHIELLDSFRTNSTVRAVAEKLHLSQPAISKMVREIEETCGMELFIRSRRGMQPTAHGLILIRQAGHMIQHLRAAAEQFKALETGASGLLRIGSSSMTHELQPAIVELQRDFPGLLVRIRQARPRQLVADLLAGDLDCAVTSLPPDWLAEPEATQLTLETIAKDHLCVVVSRKHPLAVKKALDWRDLMGERWAVSELDGLTRQQLISVYLQRGLEPPTPSLESINHKTILEVVSLDPGLLGVLRWNQARQDSTLYGLKVLPVGPRVPLPEVSFIVPKYAAAEPAVVERLRAALLGHRPRASSTRQPARGRNTRARSSSE